MFTLYIFLSLCLSLFLSPIENAGIGSRRFPSTYFPIHYSLRILPFDVTQYMPVFLKVFLARRTVDSVPVLQLLSQNYLNWHTS